MEDLKIPDRFVRKRYTCWNCYAMTIRYYRDGSSFIPKRTKCEHGCGAFAKIVKVKP